MLDSYHQQRDSDLYREFIALVDSLSESLDALCRLWMFRGRDSCFSVFEAAQPQRIVGCFKRPGMSDTEFNATENA